MNDNAAKSGSALAIIEKKPHRPGGCVGIFFQLFDWNRRFAKKKLFSKKLLPPARAKQASKKFGGDEKLPKFRLIADENSGGFPNVNKNGTHCVDTKQKAELRAPSLVARLMGLESMPAKEQDKSKKASFSGIASEMEEKFVNNQCVFTKEDQNLGKGSVKHDLRPQKVQKTEALEQRPVTRFGAEALQFKSVFSRSKKHHHPKLTSPVKSPRLHSGRKSSMLIDVAAKILEPRLQAKNRVKCALTYKSAMECTPREDIMMDRPALVSPDLSKNSDCYAGGVKPFMGHQSSCTNCGNLMDVVDSRPNLEERSSVSLSPFSNYVNPSRVSEMSKPRPTIDSFEQEGERLMPRSQEQFANFGAQVRENTQTHSESVANRNSLSQGQIHWNSTSQQFNPQKDLPFNVGFKPKTRRQNQMPVGKDRVPPRSRFNNLHSNRVSSAANYVNETKDFVALNRSLSGRTKTRVPSKLDDYKFDLERKSCSRRDDSLSPVRKRSSTNIARHNESSGLASSASGKQRNVKCDDVTEKVTGLNGHSWKRTSIESRSAHLRERKETGGNKDNDVISFTFNSQMKHKTKTVTKVVEKMRDKNDNYCSKTQVRHIISDDSDAKTCSQKPFALGGDALGAIIEQKLKELTCQDQDESATGCKPPKRTTAMILQELISALTAEGPVSQDDVAVESSRNEVSCSSGHMLNPKLAFQAKTRKAAGASVTCSLDSDHLSPGSVLEASFSNNSCFSSSLDANSGHGRPDSIDSSYKESQQCESDADLFDSATSLSKSDTSKEFVTDLLNLISKVLCTTNFAEVGFSGAKTSHAKEVILNAELLFRNGSKDFSVSYFLFDELGTLASTLWTNFDSFLGFEETKEGNQLKGFIFDCVVEYLDSRYGRYCTSGFKGWTEVPLFMNAEILIRGVVEEIRRWGDLDGLIPDELIEREMSRSLGKWTDFEIEASETGAEIDGEILKILVDEIVIDLWDCRLGS